MTRIAHAIIMGGGHAGLLAAAALSGIDRPRWEITTLERDREPKGSEPRAHVPQAHHPHVLLSSGRTAIEELLPGIASDLVSSGSIPTDMTRSNRWYQGGGWKAQFDSGIELLLQSRTLLEETIRRRLSKLPNVRFRYDTPVRDIIHDAQRQQVTGVVLDDGERLSADLVIDARGRASSLARSLLKWGYGTVPELSVELNLTYVSCTFRRPPGGPTGILGIYNRPPLNRRGGVLLQIEGDRWIVGLTGYHGERPPTTVEGFLEFASMLEQPDIHEAIVDAEVLSGPVSFSFPRQTWRRYAALRSFPQGIVPIGDAIACVDPVFGQGMSIAALEAAILRRCAECAPVPCLRFLTDCERIVKTPWLMTSMEMAKWYRRDGLEGGVAGIVERYADYLSKGANYDPEIYRAFIKVMNLEAHPLSLLHPKVTMRAVRRAVSFRER